MYGRRIDLSTNNSVELEIDGKKLNAKPGSMLIEVADDAGIPIPRFCYHRKLSIAANCRMCLVEVEKVGKPLPACATPVTAGMKVFTQSAKARQAQRAVMEFLLINHPLDCPICDQGGECELQDISLEYGKDVSRFTEGKRSVADEDIGPLVATEMTRCIQCTRCVRFGDEIAGVRELGALGRGENLWIGTYIQKSLSSEIAGNIIDLCPVGALTSKPYHFTARAWELTQHRSVAPHDCLGSNIFIHSRRQDVMRVVPRENEAINETWLSDRDRFSYQGIHNHKRITRPLVKINGEWQETDWDVALRTVVAKISGTLTSYDQSQLAALISPSATTEELYLFQKIMRSLGCSNIDHRIHQTDFADQDHLALMPAMVDCTIADIENQNTLLLLGSYVQHEQPLLATRIRKAVTQGASVFAINPIDYAFSFDVEKKIIAAPSLLIHDLASLAALIAKKCNHSLPEFVSQHLHEIRSSNTETLEAIADHLINAEQGMLLLGDFAHHHPQASTIRSLAHLISQYTACKIVDLTFGANAAGAWYAGAIPHRKAAGHPVTHSGLNAKEAFQKKLKAYFLFGIEPDKDLAYSQDAIEALSQAEIVVACASFNNPVLMNYAQVILPIGTLGETSGTFINVEGKWQSFTGAVQARAETRPGWKVLRALANFFDLPGFDQSSSEEVRDELKALKVHHHTDRLFQDINLNRKEHLVRLSSWPIYQVDSLVRHAEALQLTPINAHPSAHIHENLAKQLNLKAGENILVTQGTISVVLPLIVDSRIPEQAVYIPSGFSETAKLNASFSEISLARVPA